MLVLGLESTCDETAAAVVKDGKEILSNVISSQIDLHKEYGGVVPELACRRHAEVMIPVIEEALAKANATYKDIDLVAVAKGPGLIGALLIGVNTAKGIALGLKKPLVGVNHIEAHLYATLMTHPLPEFPVLGVILSGGHTTMVLMTDVGSYKLIGQTVDDAIGEAFDKAAKMLGLPYPGGPEIEKLAKEGNPKAFPFKAGHVKTNPLAFSFSGLKTAVLYALKNNPSPADIAASFQEAAFKDVIDKLKLAIKLHGTKTILLGGGVTNSRTLREKLKNNLPDQNFLFPDFALTLDNAAMIAGLGYHIYTRQGGDSLNLTAETSISLES